MPKVFISYRRNDSAYVAGLLSDKLRHRFGNDSVFVDVDNAPLGIDFRQHLFDAVSDCDVLLVLIGNNWLEEVGGKRRLDDPLDFVRLEIEAGLSRNIPVIPVLVDNAAVPPPEELPESIRELAFRNGSEIRAGRDLNHHIAALTNSLTALQTTRVRPTESGNDKSSDNTDKSVNLFVWLAVIAVVLAACALLVAINPLIRKTPTPEDPATTPAWPYSNTTQL